MAAASSPPARSTPWRPVEKYGALKGGYLALKRLSRCHPFHFGEHEFYDPVP